MAGERLIVLGIDPGVGGALAVYGSGRAVEVYDMPVADTGVKNRRTVDAPALNALLGCLQFDRIVLEEVSSMPRDGAIQAFAFGRSFGKIEALVAAWPCVYVRPAKWKGVLCVPSNKDASRRIASRLMPDASHLWPLKKHDGRAEAALIAYYGVKHVH